MRTLKVIVNAEEQRSDTFSILKGENQMLIQLPATGIKDLIMILQDIRGLKRRVHLSDQTLHSVSENVKSVSSFWFESQHCEKDCEITVLLK